MEHFLFWDLFQGQCGVETLGEGMQEKGLGKSFCLLLSSRHVRFVAATRGQVATADRRV